MYFLLFCFTFTAVVEGEYQFFSSRLLLFKVLVILGMTPTAAPFESVTRKELVAKVCCIYLILKVLGTLGIGLSCCRTYKERAVFALSHHRIVQWIDVDSLALTVVGEHFGAFHIAEVET